MATLNDTALASNDASGTTLSTDDALNVTAGDLVVAGVKFEGATTTVTFDTGGSTPVFSVANAVFHHAATNDLNGATAYWIATSSGTVTPRVVLGASRAFRKLKAYSFTPAGGTTLQLGNVAATEQVATDTPSAGSAAATAAGVAVVFFQCYGSEALTPGTGWSEAAEFDITDAQTTEYQLQTGAVTLTGDGSFGVGSEDVISQMAIFNQAAAGGGTYNAVPQLDHYYRMISG
jgi:hypothetical protein